jgi:chromosome segregation ATPase
MESNKTALAWLVAVVFMGTTALFAWQYARARTDAAELRTDYESLRMRLEEQEGRNAAILGDVERMQEQLGLAADQIEALKQQIESLQ